MYTASYNFHNLISISINSESNGFKNFFRDEYSRYAMPYNAPSTAPVINLQIKKKLPNVQKDDIYNKIRFKNLFSCEYVIKNLQTKHIRVVFKVTPTGGFFVRPYAVFIKAYVLHPLIYYLLLNQNILFLGCGLAANETGIIIEGKSGSGKTSLCISLLRRGFDFVAESLLFVDPQKQILYGGEHKVLVSSHNIPDMNLRPSQVALLRYKALICPVLEFMTKKRFLPRIWVYPEYVNSKMSFSPPVKYKTLLLVNPAENTTSLNLEDNFAVKQLIDTLASHSQKIPRLYSYVLFQNEELINKTKKKERFLLNQLVSSLSSAEYINTRLMDDNALDRLAAKLHDSTLKR